MKNILLSALLICVGVMSAQAQIKSNSDLVHNNIVNINGDPINGYLEHLPPGYHSNPDKLYPMIVFLHGKGEKGDGSSQIYRAAKNGPPREVERDGKLCFTVNGKQECFIVISPQTSRGWGSNQQRAFWEYILNGPKNYRYDPERIYLTGLSLGGNGAWRWVQSGEPLASKVAAIAPVCGWGDASNACAVANEEIAVWGFHGTEDNTVSYDWGKSVYDALVQCNNPGNKEWKWTPIQNKAHGIWGMVYKTDHTNFNPNVYEWFLKQRKSQSSGGTTNQKPSVSIASVNSVTLPTGQVDFTANASDADGFITNYSWSKVSGPSASLANTNSAKMTASSLSAGTYEFKVVVTDDDGAKSSSIATLVVNPEPTPNQAPDVNAGANITMTEGSNAFMSASANDADGWISSYAWTKISGPAVTMNDKNKLNMTVVSPAPGSYEFQLKVTDNDGATAQDRVLLVVEEKATTNDDLVIRAGDDFTVDVSTGSFETIARWDDISDAYVTNIVWKKISGPAITITQGDKARLKAKDINVGVYDFKITVTDSKGRTGSDNVLITVTGSSDDTGGSDLTGDFPVDAGEDFEWDASKGGFNILARWDLPNTYVTDITWQKVSGPAASLKQKKKAKLIVDAPAKGTFKFKVTITDNKNRVGVDEIIVNVIEGDGTATTGGISVDAGDDFEWHASKGDFNVLARLDIPDAYVKNIKWDKVSGDYINMKDKDKAKMWLIGPKKGVYTFRVTIKDSKGRTASDKVTVTVVDGIVSAMAGSDDVEDSMPENETRIKNFITSGDQIALLSENVENLQVQLININGVTLKVDEFNGQLNAAVLSSGMYIYQVFNEEGFIIQKGRIIKN